MASVQNDGLIVVAKGFGDHRPAWPPVCVVLRFSTGFRESLDPEVGSRNRVDRGERRMKDDEFIEKIETRAGLPVEAVERLTDATLGGILDVGRRRHRW